MTTRKRALWAFVILLLFVLAGDLIHKATEVIYPKPTGLARPAPACDLSAGPCTAYFAAGGQVAFEVEPHGIPVARPLVLRVTTQGLEVTAVAVDFVGRDMNMGYNRPVLVPDGPGRYRGTGMLPVCVRERMTWEARVLLTTPRGLLAAPFHFATSS
ncbi:MAG TPA: hypothetical protein VES73_12375 [Lamprocystis sp. (in: g-proteobacteria)]|nr:hypothetical protein [Lamprocystis sp. (in: g-proteobacteria)]